MSILVIWTACILLSTARYIQSFTLHGEITGIGSRDAALPKDEAVLNIDIPESRFDIRLYELTNNSNYQVFRSCLDEKHSFNFANLSKGSYDLILSSHDYTLKVNRFRVLADKESLIALPEDLGNYALNNTLGINVTTIPLVIEVMGLKSYYEVRLDSLLDMVRNSPLGFIFANRIYTFMFLFCLAFMAVPYLLQWLNPAFAEELKKAQVESRSVSPQDSSTKVKRKVDNIRSKDSAPILRQRKVQR